VKTLGLLGLALGALALAALASPWVAAGLLTIVGRPFSVARVFDRTFEVVLVVGLVVSWRRLDLGGAREVGFTPRDRGAQMVRGFGIGVVGLAVGLGLCAVNGALIPALRFSLPKTAWKAALGVAAAVLVGAGEEGLFRGVLWRRLERDAGPATAVVLSTLLYAVVHLMRASAPPASGSWAGTARIAALVAPLGEPAALAPGIGLVLLGLVLAAARRSTGGVWLSIGIHAAWVGVFRVGRLLFTLGPRPVWLVGQGWPPLVGGAAGWLAAGVCGLLLVLWRPPRADGEVSSRLT
jgi:membrane protease YdiL (CAAX protease family)